MGTPLLLPSLRASIENLKHHVDILVRMGHDEIMRSYGQNCALAKALDVVGDRWTLLIVRELMIRDRCRYTDLRNGLPGIATNLLAERLNEMEQAGLVTREAAPPPIATTLFQLTNRGKELEPVIAELGRWGAPLLADGERIPPFKQADTHVVVRSQRAWLVAVHNMQVQRP